MSMFQQMFGKDSAEPLVDKDKEEFANLPESEKRYQGKITKISPNGWGFISTKEIPFTRIFFHWTGLAQDTKHFTALARNMTVEFNTIKHPEKGMRATKIKVIEET